MRPTVFYKPSNKFSVVGTLLLVISVIAAGLVLSWIYLILNSVIPIAQLCIIMPFLLSFALGGIGSVFVKTYKIRNPLVAVAAITVALLVVNYLKWAIYVSRDFNKYYYKDMKEESAVEYYGLDVFTYDDLSVDDVMVLCQSLKASDAIELTPEEIGKLTDEERESYYSDSLWDFMEYGDLLGSSPDEVERSVEKAEGMTAYEFKFKYNKIPAMTAPYLAAHPAKMFSSIKDINEVGRWYIGRSSLDHSNVSGIMLWLVWFGELVIIIAPAVFFVYKAAKRPFIEDEDIWAFEEKTDGVFRFDDSSPDSFNGMTGVKKNLLQSPDYLLTLKPITTGSLPPRFYSLSYCHSKYFDENYITISCTAENPNKKGSTTSNAILENISVDPDYIATVYGMFGAAPPPMCRGTDRHEEFETVKMPDGVKSTGHEDIFEKSAEEIINDRVAPHTPQNTAAPAPAAANAAQTAAASQPAENIYRPADTTSGSMDGLDTSSLNIQPPPQSAPVRYAPESYNSPTSSGDMDGLDTSNLDLSNLK